MGHRPTLEGRRARRPPTQTKKPPRGLHLNQNRSARAGPYEPPSIRQSGPPEKHSLTPAPLFAVVARPRGDRQSRRGRSSGSHGGGSLASKLGCGTGRGFPMRDAPLGDPGTSRVATCPYSDIRRAATILPRRLLRFARDEA